jgi:nucleotide-binding universal stress UspA family protein
MINSCINYLYSIEFTQTFKIKQKMKKVLIALDYGVSAQDIAEKGYELAKGLNAKITLLHVVADESYYNNIDSGPFMFFYGTNFFNMIDSDNLIDASLGFLERIKSNLKDSEIEIEAIQGDFSNIILETANNHRFDVIVMGLNSRNWIDRTIMGSVTESVLKESIIPLFIIPIKEHK